MVPKILRTPPKSSGGSISQADRKEAIEFRLTVEQETAFRKIKECLNDNRFSELFIFGVTGGGKSELYIRAIKEVLQLCKSAICLVPEIALTEQIKLFFMHHFHGSLEILHSKLTDRERFEVWQRIKRGESRVILGARSAVFAPAVNLGLMIIDEEQEGSYKQDQAPRYHTREIARWRAQDLSAVLLMGTATPTIETMHRAHSKQIEMVTLSKRIDERPMPDVFVIALKQASEITKRLPIISHQLEEEMTKALSAKQGILLMLNRRGFSTHVRCVQCAYALFCSHCAVALTFHQEDQQVLCHYCNYHAEVPNACPRCKSPLLKFSGIGTEKVESEVARLFPNARVGRLDTDSTRIRGAHDQILTRFRNRELDVLVGTQMIAKGFDFQHVTLVGIINADTSLLLPDFRSSERTFQLLTQMAGRTGRGKERGRVLIQTYSPTHYVIGFSSKHDYEGFYQTEIESRKSLRYPPFTKLINIMISGKKEALVREQAVKLRHLLEKRMDSNPRVELIGPAPLPLYRLRGHFRWHLMIRLDPQMQIQGELKQALAELKKKAG